MTVIHTERRSGQFLGSLWRTSPWDFPDALGREENRGSKKESTLFGLSNW